MPNKLCTGTWTTHELVVYICFRTARWQILNSLVWKLNKYCRFNIRYKIYHVYENKLDYPWCAIKGEYAFGGAKNKYFKLKLRKKSPVYCFLVDNNRSFRSNMFKSCGSKCNFANWNFLFYFLCILLFFFFFDQWPPHKSSSHEASGNILVHFVVQLVFFNLLFIPSL